MTIFADRADAGRQLARALLHLKPDRPVVLALPRGGVPVGFEVARILEAPLDVLLVRKIGFPGYPELALGAVLDGEHPHLVLNRDLVELAGVDADYIAEQEAIKLKEIEDRRALYLRGRPRPSVAGRTAIIVDDGVATGATMKAAIDALRGYGRPASGGRRSRRPAGDGGDAACDRRRTGLPGDTACVPRRRAVLRGLRTDDRR